MQSQLGADVRTIQHSAATDGGASMFIRGLSSINNDAQPLVVIDGVEQDMQRTRFSLHDGQFNNMLANISPDDVQKVTVLKNATALYGARGANGVILIETKRGHSMATRIDANISAGVTLKPRMLTLMNAEQYRIYATELMGTIDGQDRQSTKFRFLNDDPSYYYYHMYHNDTDWKNEVYRNTALTQNYSINVQGGDDIGMYNLSVGYVDSKYAIKETGFNRMNVRFNTDIKITWRLETKFDISIARTNSKQYDDGMMEDFTSGTVVSPTTLALIKSPMVSPYQYNTLLNGGQGGFTSLLSSQDDIFQDLPMGNQYSLANPLTMMENGEGDNKNKAENTYFNVHVAPTYNLGKGFRVTAGFSYTLNRNAQRYYRPVEGVPSFNIPNVGRVYGKTVSMFSKENNFFGHLRVDWSKQMGRHYVNAYVGGRYNYFSYDNNFIGVDHYASTSDKNPSLGNDGSKKIDGANDVWKTIQWFGNVDYNYMNRYFATVSLMAEANSRFGVNADALKMFGVRWALFPSVQLGWVMTNERWFPKSRAVNYLKLNAGFDVSGNDGISNYAAYTVYSAVRYNSVTGTQLTNIGNDKIQWESTKKFNVGLQGHFVDNRVSLNFNYFIHNTDNLLTLKNFTTPIAGINQYWSNGGKLQNKGFELSVSGKPIVARNWQLEVGATMGHYVNTVKALPELKNYNGYEGTVQSLYGTDNILTAEGLPVAMFYGYQTEGVFTTDAEASKAHNGADYLYMVDAANNKTAFRGGDVHFVDRNGDGVINESDKTVIGNPNPDLYGNIFANLSWKDFTLSMNFNYSLGNDVYNYQRSILNAGSNFYNQQVAEVGRWTYDGQQTNIPRAVVGDPMGNNRFSDRWIEDGSYLRLKTLNLTYRVPVPGSWDWLQGLTVWAEATNLFTLTKYTGCDPETSIGYGVYYQGIDTGLLSQSRSFTLGVKINL
jgi:TonB-linked SusC/RagA family outer membrane protein